MDASPTSDQRTSWLAGMGFLCGLATALLVVGAGILYLCAQLGDALTIERVIQKALLLATKLALYCSLAPAVGALAFWIGARGVIREAQGRLRGVGLYRSGVILTVLSLACAFAGRNSLGAGAESGLVKLKDVPLKVDSRGAGVETLRDD